MLLAPQVMCQQQVEIKLAARPTATTPSKMLRALVIGVLIASTFAASDTCKQNPEIVARGVGRRAVPAALAVIRLGVSAQADTASDAQAKVANASNSLLAFINGNNVSELGTTGISLMPELNYTAAPPTVVGYSARNTISFEISVAQAGFILDGAVGNGATRISSVAFKPNSKVALDARTDALEDAVERARKEARAAARGAGVSLGEVSHILIDDTFEDTPIQSRSVQAESLSVAADSQTPVVARDQIIVARVIVRFTIIPKSSTLVVVQ